MSLLSDIQNGATEDSVSLGSLLRKVKLLAARIGVKEIGEWAQRELSGYDNTKELPPYRGPFQVTVLGHGMDEYGREYKAFPIPPLAFEEKYRDSILFKLYFMQGVKELESIAATKETARAQWSADTVAGLPWLIQEGLVELDPSITWIEIWKPIPFPTIIGVLDDIRTRLLDFTMQIGEEEPSVEDEERITDPKRVQSVTNVFNTSIFGDSPNVAVGNHDVTQTQTQKLPGPFDIDGLLDYLRKLGLDEDMINKLQDALDEDAQEEDKKSEDDEPKKPGRRVLAWLKNVSTAATTQVGTPVVTGLITEALLHYFRF